MQTFIDNLLQAKEIDNKEQFIHRHISHHYFLWRRPVLGDTNKAFPPDCGREQVGGGWLASLRHQFPQIIRTRAEAMEHE